MMKNIIIARQPIFDKAFKLSSYELLFRSLNASKHSDDQMTAQVIVSALMDIGLEKLSGGYKININVSESFLLNDLEIIHALPPEIVGIEILETVTVNDATIRACKTLKEKGFTLLLDDVVYAPHLNPLIDLADIIKVDLPRVSNLAEEVRKLRKFPAKLLAEKVETHEQFEQIKALNFDYAQGYFFSKPEILEGRKLPDSKMAILLALQKVLTAENISEIQHVIKQDISLSYRLVKYINSASFGFRQPVESMEQALALLGLNNIRRWLSILALATLGNQKSPELIKNGLIRAAFLESIAKTCRRRDSSNAFLLGMFSILDALLDMDMTQALHDLHLPTGVRDGLLDLNSAMGKNLAMCIALERAEWENVEDWLAQQKHLDFTSLNQHYIDAIIWADQQATTLR